MVVLVVTIKEKHFDDEKRFFFSKNKLCFKKKMNLG